MDRRPSRHAPTATAIPTHVEFLGLRNQMG
jgi:hypothetical protein